MLLVRVVDPALPIRLAGRVETFTMNAPILRVPAAIRAVTGR